MNLKLPEETLKIIEKLNTHGYEAFVVGGCVRDSIIGLTPKDWDITTNAKPDEVKNLFTKTIDTGLKHGTVTVLIDDKSLELTTYRIDGQYTDSRHPQSVEFTSSLQNDLCRRDFTINAIAYHPMVGFVDFYGGLQDIKSHLIKAVGSAEERFTEDALRMLRAIRFSAQLGFSIEPDTLAAIEKKGILIKNISSERIRDELTKTLLSDSPIKFNTLHTTGILKHILPEFDACYHVAQNHPYHIYNVADHCINSVSHIQKDTALRWTMLLHDIGKRTVKTTDDKGIDHFYGHPAKSMDMAKDILTRLRFDTKTLAKVCRLIKDHDRHIEPTFRSVRKAVHNIGDDIFMELLKVQTADKSAQNPKFLEERIQKFERIKCIYLEIKEKGQCMSLKNLALNGNDLLAMGFSPGKEIGEILQKLLEAVIENPEFNTKERLSEMCRQNI